MDTLQSVQPKRMDTQSLQPIINFIWTVADDVLINKYLENQYQDVILPMTVLRRLDLALEPTKDKVFQTYEAFKDKIDNLSGLLTSEQHGSGMAFYNTSPRMKETMSLTSTSLRRECSLTVTDVLLHLILYYHQAMYLIHNPGIDTFTL